MKKMLCLVLALVMALSLAIPAMADNGITNGSEGTTTTVTYTPAGETTDPEDPTKPGTGETVQETWTVSVPASVEVGDTGTVSVSGNLRTGSKLTVAIDSSNVFEGTKKVAMKNGEATKYLSLTFADLVVNGSNAAAVSGSGTVIVGNWGEEGYDAAPVFGTWTGTITYTATLNSVTDSND